MKALSSIFADDFIQTAAGIICTRFCAACWKIGSPGVDIKISSIATAQLGIVLIHARVATITYEGNLIAKHLARVNTVESTTVHQKACKVPYPGQECTS